MMLSGATLAFVLAWLFAFGATVGSFLNVCIYRLPQHVSLLDQLRCLWHPPSTCPKCGKRLLSRDNIPIIGWVKLGGRCRFCRSRISFRYPFFEFLNGCLFVLIYLCEIRIGTFGDAMYRHSLYYEYGPQIIQDGWSTLAWLHWRYAYHMILVEALLVVSMIDFDTTTIPDASTDPAIVLGFILSTAIGQVFLVPVWIQDPSSQYLLMMNLPDWLHWSAGAIPDWIATSPHLHGLANSLAGFLVGGGIVLAVRIIGGRILKQEAMGFGDVILLALIGTYLGWQAAVMTFFIAPLCAICVVVVNFVLGGRNRSIPYGPYLSLGALMVIVFWNQLWRYFEPFFQSGPFVFFAAVFMMVGMVISLLITQRVKLLLGIPLYPDEWEEDWTRGDHLMYYNDGADNSGSWTEDRWPGESYSRGEGFNQDWNSSE